MTDLAQLGIELTSNGIDQTNAKLDTFVGKAASAGNAADTLESKTASAFKNTGTAATTGADRVNSAFSAMTAGISNANKLTTTTGGSVKSMGASIDAALTKNVVSFDTFRQGVTRANTEIGSGSAKAVDTLVKSSGLARYELINLSRQFQDVGVSLAGGQSPFLVAMQQGSQIADVFASTEGSVKGFFEQVTAGAGRILTPMRLAVGGVLGLGAAALYIGHNWSESAAQIDRALTGIGGRTGETYQSINKFAAENASLTGLSVAQTRDIALEFTKTGNIAVSGLKGVGEAVRGFSVLTGQDATAATKTFADALGGDLVKGAEKLNATYGTMNSATMEYIRTLEVQGERSKAIQVIIDSIEPANKRAADSVGFLSKAYSGLSNVVSNIFNGVPNSQSDKDKLAGLQKQRDDAANSPNLVGSNPGGYGLLNTGALFGGKSQQLSDLDKQIDDLQKKINAFDASHVGQQLTAMSNAGDAVVKSVLPQIDAIHNLDKAIKTLESAQNTPGVSRGLGAGTDEAALNVMRLQRQEAQESLSLESRRASVVMQLKEAYGGVSSQTAIALQSLQGELAVASQRTVQGQIQAQYQATINSLLVQGVSAEEATSVAAAQRAVSEERVYQSMQKAVDASRDQVALYAAQGTADEASVKAKIAYRNAIDAGADSTQAAIIANNTGAVAAAQWAEQAQKIAQAYEDAQRAAEAAQYADAGGSFGSFQRKDGITGVSVETFPYWQKQLLQQASVAPLGVTDQINSILGKGKGINSALSSAKGLKAGTVTNNPADYLEAMWGLQPGQLGLSKSTNINDSDIIGQVQQLYDLKNSQTSDASVKTANLQEEMAWLQSRPETLARDQAIAQLTQAMNSNTDATGANTASLNPLYNGRSALKVGYYKAANGLDMMAQGPTSGDQVPFHAMVNGGERIRITRAGEDDSASTAAGNDNSKTVVNHNTFNFGSSQSGSNRRNARQVAQGYGQTMAALS